MATSDYLNKPSRDLYDIVIDPEVSWITRRMAWLEILARLGAVNPVTDDGDDNA